MESDVIGEAADNDGGSNNGDRNDAIDASSGSDNDAFVESDDSDSSDMPPETNDSVRNDDSGSSDELPETDDSVRNDRINADPTSRSFTTKYVTRRSTLRPKSPSGGSLPIFRYLFSHRR